VRAILLLVATVALAAGLQFQGTGPAEAVCSVLKGHPCTPGVCSVLSGHPCTPTVCSVLHHGPCVPEIQYPLGQDLRLTIVSKASDRGLDGGDVANDSGTGGTPDTDHKLNTILDMFAALRACWVPPPQDEARPGMQMSVRLSFKRDGEIIGTPRVTYTSPDAPATARDVYHNAITAALDRCTPLPFTSALGGALAGRPIAIRFVDDRTSS
jgi:hypothetical protein